MSSDIIERIKRDLAQNDVVLFMKGTPAAPLCGFSSAVVQVLNTLGVSFAAFDVMSDPDLRQGAKDFADWPTFPQLYVKGEFVGGCDIVREMAEAGELQELLGAKGIAYTAV